MSEKKTTLPSLGNQDSQVWNRESERLIDKYPDRRHHGGNNLIYAGAKNQGPLEDNW